jgi:cyclophilin family peptidyl-prolyl cis-trans isomerase
MPRLGTTTLIGIVLFGALAVLDAAETGPATGPAKQGAGVDQNVRADDAHQNSSGPTDDAGSQTNSGDFKSLVGQWRSALADLAQVQARLNIIGPEQREAISQQYWTAMQRAGALASQVQAAAEKAYAANETDPEVGQLLFSMAVGNLRKDNYEEALRLAKLLIAGKYPDKDIYRVAATSAFVTMQLDEAKKFLEALGDGRVPSEPDLQEVALAIEHYRPLWQWEQKLRQADAKANDLPRVKLQTTQGDMVLELFENEAPNTVANFIKLVEQGLYDGTQFHRVLPGFMAQGGDPLSKDPLNKENIGKGGPGYTIADEFQSTNRRDHFRGTLSMAHTSQANSGGSQFFLTFAPTPSLDGGYTAFGRVIDGMDVLSKLQRVDPEREHDRPSGAQPDKIVKAEVLRKRNHAYEPKTIP